MPLKASSAQRKQAEQRQFDEHQEVCSFSIGATVEGYPVDIYVPIYSLNNELPTTRLSRAIRDAVLVLAGLKAKSPADVVTDA